MIFKKQLLVFENKMLLSSSTRSNQNFQEDFFTLCILVHDWKGLSKSVNSRE